MNLRRFLFILFVIALAPPGFAQSLAKTFTLSAANQNACIGTNNLPTIGIDLTGTASLTLQPQVSINGSSPKTSSVTSTVAGSSAQATIVLSGATAASYVAAVGGFDTFCLNVSSYSSGKIVVVLNPSSALNASLLGGGGSGSGVTSFGPTGSPRTGVVVTEKDDYSDVSNLSLGDGTQVINWNTAGCSFAFSDTAGDAFDFGAAGCSLGGIDLFDVQLDSIVLNNGIQINSESSIVDFAPTGYTLETGTPPATAVTVDSSGNMVVVGSVTASGFSTSGPANFPTQAAGNNTTLAATTAFVTSAIAANTTTVVCTDATPCPSSLTTMKTTASGGAFVLYGVVNCTSAVSGAMIGVTMGWTDASGTGQSVVAAPGTCTTLGAISFTQFVRLALTGAATNIQYEISGVAGSPVYKAEFIAVQLSSL